MYKQPIVQLDVPFQPNTAYPATQRRTTVVTCEGEYLQNVIGSGVVVLSEEKNNTNAKEPAGQAQEGEDNKEKRPARKAPRRKRKTRGRTQSTRAQRHQTPHQQGAPQEGKENKTGRGAQEQSLTGTQFGFLGQQLVVRGLGDGARVKEITPTTHRGVLPRSRSQGNWTLAWKGITPSSMVFRSGWSIQIARSRSQGFRHTSQHLASCESCPRVTPRISRVMLNKPAPRVAPEVNRDCCSQGSRGRRDLSKVLECCFRDEGTEVQLWNMRSMTSEKKPATP